MDSKDIFALASRNKYRFPFKGSITTEELWDLGLTDLDSIFKKLKAKIKTLQEDTLLTTPSVDEDNTLSRIEIIKYIVSVKQDEAKKKIDNKKSEERRNQIQKIIENKKNEALNSMTVEELTKLLENI